MATDAAEGGEAVYARVAAAVRAALDAFDGEVLGVGIGSAGVVDPKTGGIAYANEIMPGWGGIALGPRLAEELDMPVAVTGDVHAHALGEARWGVGRGYESVLCLGIGTGIGGAFVMDGRVMRGSHGAAGHMGHIESTAAAGDPVRLRALGPSRVRGVGHLHRPDLRGALRPRRPVAPDGRPRRQRPGRRRRPARDRGRLRGGPRAGREPGHPGQHPRSRVIVLSGGVIHEGTGWRSETWRTSVAEGYRSQALDPLEDTPILIGVLEGEAPLIGAAENLLDTLR